MMLPLDPRLPIPELSLDYQWRLNARLYELLRQWAGTINPWLGPSWEDLRFPAQGINPSGAPSAASFDTSTYYGTLLFSGSAEQHVAGVAQLPHSALEGGELRPHIHWSKTTADAGAGAVTWEFRYATAAIGGALSAYSAWGAGTLVVGDLTTLEKHNITSFAAIDMTGFGASDMLVWGLRRLGNTDAYNSDARLLEFDFHYQIGQVGTSNRQEYPT